ncbi:MAG: ethylbenzene dehydrogenase-related protein, partial [Candidatus Thiodiazotropha sp.]
SRTKVEEKGRRGKKLGGWDKLKENADLQAELDARKTMDLVRISSGSGRVENGYILDQRVMEGGEAVQGSIREEAGYWTATFKRKLKSELAEDVSIEKDRLYNFGFAIHDDHTSSRFHHVSLGYRLGLDNPDAEINAMAQ